MTKLTCQACADFLADYLNDELEAGVRASFEVHLDRCRNCRAYLDQYAGVIKAGRRACEREDQLASEALPEELVRAILDSQSRHDVDG